MEEELINRRTGLGYFTYGLYKLPTKKQKETSSPLNRTPIYEILHLGKNNIFRILGFYSAK